MIYTFSALVSIWNMAAGQRMQDRLRIITMFIVKKEHVTQCNGVVYLCVFNCFWTKSELHGTKECDISGFG